jgi:hypothetical protein
MMPLARPLIALVAALLLLPTMATALAAQVVGETWTSPTYGFNVSWAGTEWTVEPSGTLTAAGPERLDRVHLLNGVSSLYFEGATRYHGNLSSCVAEEANLLSEETGVSGIRPYRDSSGAPFAADGPNSSAAAFSLTLAVGGQEVELIDYVECRTLIPDEAVLIITLVTEPNVFESELASAQAVIDTLAEAQAPALDPLAAYGGWIAVAQQQPSIAGPLSGALAFGPGDLAVERAGVDAPDAYIRAEFVNPEPLPEMWDFGLGFRDSGGEEQLRLIVDSSGAWFFKDGLGGVIASGSVVDVDTGPSGANTIEIVAAGDTGYFAFNERLVGEIDLSARPAGGDVFVGAGFFAEDAADAATTAYRGFEIWSLAGLEPAMAIAPSLSVDESTFAGITAASTAAAPLAGPASGELVQTIGAATVMPIGADVEDFVAHVVVVNPSAAGDAPWDFGIAFREQENGDHYRLTIASDGTWEFQIGLQAELGGGAVPSLNLEAGERNTLDLVVAGDAAGFAVNGAFVSQLDTAQLNGASDVWVGAGFHQANVVEDEATPFEDFTVWAIAAPPVAQAPATPVAATPAMATPIGGATPVASLGQGGDEIAFRLVEQAESGIDALAVLTAVDERTRIDIVARDATGAEAIVVHDGPCGDASALPAFLLEDFDAAGRSETFIAAPLADLTDGAHSIAIHRSAEAYGEIVACGEIPVR